MSGWVKYIRIPVSDKGPRSLGQSPCHAFTEIDMSGAPSKETLGDQGLFSFPLVLITFAGAGDKGRSKICKKAGTVVDFPTGSRLLVRVFKEKN